MKDACSAGAAAVGLRLRQQRMKRGWVKSDKKPALNADLWQELLPLIARHDVRYHWVKGHAANEKNNRCDQLAVAESKKF